MVPGTDRRGPLRARIRAIMDQVGNALLRRRADVAGRADATGSRDRKP